MSEPTTSKDVAQGACPLNFDIGGMHCAACSARIERVVGAMEGVDAAAVNLADASLRYGRLWRQGIPYNTMMKNNINHPDARGMRIFADSLIALFPGAE